MKIAIPTADGVLCAHFGHCQYFTIVDIDPETRQIAETKSVQPPPHEPGVLPAWLSQLGCTHIIAGGMGGRAIALFQQAGVKVTVGAPSTDPETIVKAFLDNSLVSVGNPCDDDPSFHTGGHNDCGNH